MDRHASTLRRQATAAARHGRPVAWLALVLSQLAERRPKGMSPTTGRVAAMLAASGDFASGRRARPGRQVCAYVLDVSERTVERHWRILESLGVAERTAAGRWLSAGERAEAYADQDAANRWRDRQEWRLVIPPEVRGRDVDQRHETRARALLAELAGAGAGRPVDNRPAARPAGLGRVAPSIGVLGLYLGCPLRAARSQTRPGGRKPRQASLRDAHRQKNRPDSGRRVPAGQPEAVDLARQLAAGGRIPWLRDVPRYLVASTLRRLQGWSAVDVIEACNARLAESGRTMPDQVAAPASFLRWLLMDVDPDRPPVTGRRERSAAAAAAAADRAASRAAGPVATAAPAYVRETAAAAAAAGRHRGRLVDAQERARVADQVTTLRAHLEEPAAPAALVMCAGCGAIGPDVVTRPLPVPLPECDACWSAISASL